MARLATYNARGTTVLSAAQRAQVTTFAATLAPGEDGGEVLVDAGVRPFLTVAVSVAKGTMVYLSTGETIGGVA